MFKEKFITINQGDRIHHPHHGIGETLRVTRHEQQAAARIELGEHAADQRALDVEAGEQAVAGQVVTQRQHVNLVVNLQLTRVVHEGFVAKAVEGLGISRRGDDGGQQGQDEDEGQQPPEMTARERP